MTGQNVGLVSKRVGAESRPPDQLLSSGADTHPPPIKSTTIGDDYNCVNLILQTTN